MISASMLLLALTASLLPLSCFEQPAEPTDFKITGQGMIYRQAHFGNALPEPMRVADLSASGWLFSSKHRVVRSYLPQTASIGQQSFEQLLLLAYDPLLQTEMLVALRVFPLQLTSWHFDQLLPYLDDATLAADNTVVTALWQQQQHAAGWWRPIPGKATQLPELYAGILYLPVAQINTETNCPSYPLDLSVHIIHMHSGHTVSPAGTLQLFQPTPLQWQLKADGDYVSLWLQQEEHRWLLQPQLQQILADCLQCIDSLKHADWPKRIPLAHFWVEEGAY